MKVTLYTKSNCPQCTMSKKFMAREGIEFEEVDLESSPELLQGFKDAGLLQAPIVVLGNDGRRWSGFQPDLLRELIPLQDAA